MIYHSNDDDDESEDLRPGAGDKSGYGSSSKPQTPKIPVEVVKAPDTILANRREEDGDSPGAGRQAEGVRAAVTVHLHAGQGVISEYLETSIAQDSSLHLYPDYVWVRRRDFYSRMIKVWIAVELMILVATLSAFFIAPLAWIFWVLVAGLGAVVLTAVGLWRLAVRKGPWWRLDAAYWSNLTYLAQRWCDEGVQSRHILARVHAAVVDAGCQDGG